MTFTNLKKYVYFKKCLKQQRQTPRHEINSFSYDPLGYLKFQSGKANSIKSNKFCSSIPPKKNYKRNKTRRNRTNKGKTAGLLDVILELRSSKFTSFEPKWF